mgnify:CR=1 FL=1
MVKKTPSPAKLRELVMQALYQKEMTGSSNTDLIKQFKSELTCVTRSELA